MAQGGTSDIDLVMALALAPAKRDRMSGENIIGLPVHLWGASGRGMKEALTSAFAKAGYRLTTIDTANRPVGRLADVAVLDRDPIDEQLQVWPEMGRRFQFVGPVHEVTMDGGYRSATQMDGLVDEVDGGDELGSTDSGEICFANSPWREMPGTAEPGQALFLGNLPSAPTTVQSGCNGIIFDHRFGEFRTPQTPVVAAGKWDRETAQSMTPDGRFIHLEWSGNDTLEVLASAGMVDPFQLDLSKMATLRDAREYDAHFSRWSAVVGAYIDNHHKEVIQEEPRREDIEHPVDLAFATMHGYSTMVRALTALDIFGIEDRQLEVIHGCIGQEMGTKFQHWLHDLRIPPLAAVYNRQVAWENRGPTATMIALQAAALHADTEGEVTALFEGMNGAATTHGYAVTVKAVRVLVARMQPEHPKTLAMATTTSVNEGVDRIATSLGLGLG